MLQVKNVRLGYKAYHRLLRVIAVRVSVAQPFSFNHNVLHNIVIEEHFVTFLLFDQQTLWFSVREHY